MIEDIAKSLAEEEESRKEFMLKVDQGTATKADIPTSFNIVEQKTWNDYFSGLETAKPAMVEKKSGESEKKEVA